MRSSGIATAGARRARRLLAAVLERRALRGIAFAPLRAVGGARWLATAARRTASSWIGYAAAVPGRRGGRSAGRARARRASARHGAAAHGLRRRYALRRDQPAHGARCSSGRALRVLVPRNQGCCGALGLHLGAAERARTLARGLVAVAHESGADWVVTNAAGCGALLRDYDHLLPGDAAAASVAARARDALALLAELGLPQPSGRIDRTIAVHDPCHLVHGQGVRDEVRTLLGAIPGVRLVPLEEADVCCGSAGTYNLTEPAMAARLQRRKLDHVAASGADDRRGGESRLSAADSRRCDRARAGHDVEHPIDLLAAAHGIS